MRRFNIRGLKRGGKRIFPEELYIFLFWYVFWVLKEAIFFWGSYTNHPVYNPLPLLLYLSLLASIIKAIPVVLSYTIFVRFIHSPILWFVTLFVIFCADFYLSIFHAENISLTSRRNGYVLYESGDVTDFGILVLILNPTLLVCAYALYQTRKSRRALQ